MWVRLDCTLASHRKLLRAGGDAAWFWVCGLAHANGHTTNGVIHRDDLVALYPCAEWSATKRRNLAAKLVEVGLWDVIDADSWMIHDYADHQSEAMSEAVEARREREREKKRTQRSAGKSMVSGNVSPGDTRGDTRGSPAVVPPRVPGVSPPSDRPTVRQTDEGEEELSPTHSGRVTVAPRPKAPKPVKPPPPFSVVEAVNAIAAALKHARDAVATWLGTGDAPSAPVTWRVEQRRAKGYAVAVRVEVAR